MFSLLLQALCEHSKLRRLVCCPQLQLLLQIIAALISLHIWALHKNVTGHLMHFTAFWHNCLQFYFFYLLYTDACISLKEKAFAWINLLSLSDPLLFNLWPGFIPYFSSLHTMKKNKAFWCLHMNRWWEREKRVGPFFYFQLLQRSLWSSRVAATTVGSGGLWHSTMDPSLRLSNGSLVYKSCTKWRRASLFYSSFILKIFLAFPSSK